MSVALLVLAVWLGIDAVALVVWMVLRHHYARISDELDAELTPHIT